MLGLRFLLHFGSQAFNYCVDVFRPASLPMPASLPVPASDPTERDGLLRSKFKKYKRRFVRALDAIIPDTDNSNKIDVIAIMPTASFDTRLGLRYESDASVIFCVNKVSADEEQEILNEKHDQMFVDVGVKMIFTFSAVTNSDYYERFLLLILSDCLKLPFEVIRVIMHADESAEDYFSTNFMAVWTAKHTRHEWMHCGLNTPSDNCLDMCPAMHRFHELTVEAVDERESEGQ